MCVRVLRVYVRVCIRVWVFVCMCVCVCVCVCKYMCVCMMYVWFQQVFPNKKTLQKHYKSVHLFLRILGTDRDRLLIAIPKKN